MKKLWIIYGAAAAGLIAVWLIALVLPLKHDQDKLKAELISAETTVAQLQQEAAQLPAILKRNSDLGDNIPGYEEDGHTREEVLTLLNKLGQQCESHSLAISEVRPPVEELILLHELHQEHPGMPQFLNVTLVLDGRYIDFGKFVTNLERSEYFNQVNFVRVKSNPDNQTNTQFMIEFKVLLGMMPEVTG
jgi:Tfp pilus assembly protein PilO